MNIAQAFPHVKPGSPEHRKIREKIKRYRQLERRCAWQTMRNLASSPVKGLDLVKEIETLYKKKRGPVKVFEVGCGYGHTLRALKAMMGRSVDLGGITLTKHAADYAAGKHDRTGSIILETRGLPFMGGFMMGDIPTVKVQTGLIEGHKLRDQDLIFSFQTMRYVIDHARALEVIANGLATGGKAILDVPKSFLGKHKKHVENYFERNGFKFTMRKVSTIMRWPRSTKLKKTTLPGRYFLVVQRLAGNGIDLSPYYKLRTRDYWQVPR